MYRLIISILLVAITSTAAMSQKRVQLKQITKKNGLYQEEYYALASDTSIKHGAYRLSYNKKIIEEGNYKKGARCGVWEFYNIHEKIEFRYDYDQRLPFNITPHIGHTYNAKNFPSIFLGSPVIPYVFIAQNVKYPVKESENKSDRKVVLALEISATGQMTGYHLEKTSRPEFNEVVLKAAAKIPKSWRWVPERSNGRNVAGIYHITIIFDAAY